ncbi:Urea-proton symporter DUR3 [Gracilariopsis chorda]|uniref:Urea-proton symporter DUR3 n=1 Tax=Gracilariopsis chorda TaxID=448386 RepID=A0A2V3IW76_9FLOR|nr:Urea-proton symporter DUR3 [Gracilariopsis chorda]|eukprot:PXF45390.1 Urea-proton symporter DUR3 [Gracilariopsis chorda]
MSLELNPFKDCDGAVNNLFGFPQYKCFKAFFTVPPLPLWSGWVVVLAFGLIFGLFTVGLVYLEHFITGVKMNSEFFNTAGRTIKTGLTASVLVSQWTWAATLLQSSNVAYKYGISGPFWYASGATIQILLFSMLAVLVKRRAPTCHTFLEIIRARWGNTTHKVFVAFALLTNIIVTSMLILGGSSVVTALTGMNTDLASFLIPLGVILYTLAGGLKATFIASYFNTAVILIALCIFIFQVYVTNDDLGSPSVVWERLNLVSAAAPVKQNYNGSYLTMLSRNGLFFGLTNIVGNFGTVFVDQSYWQSAIAATPTASWKGYLLGGLCWFAIPFSLATSLGLASVALSLPLTAKEAGKGLVPPAVAVHLLGTGGAVLILIMLFMAVTSTGAAEQIAVSSLVAYDIYRTYINPNATGRQIIFVSRIAILSFGLLMGVLGIALNAIDVNLGWLYLFMGVLIGSAVIPVAFAISWSKCSGLAAMSGAVGGLILGFTSWIAYGAADGGVNVENLGRDEIMLTGNLVSILSSGAICIVVTLFIRKDDCDWTNTKSIALVEEDINAVVSEEQDAELERAGKLIMLWGIGLTLVLVVLWPLLTLPAKAFPKGYFTFWVVLSFIWGLLATATMVILPVAESVRSIMASMKNRDAKFVDEESMMMDTGKSVTDTVAESEMTARSLEM